MLHVYVMSLQLAQLMLLSFKRTQVRISMLCENELDNYNRLYPQNNTKFPQI